MMFHLQVVVAVDVSLDVQALLERTRADADRIPLLHLAQDVLGVLRIDLRFARQILDRQVGRLLAAVALRSLEVEDAVVVEVIDDELGEALLVVGEVAHLQLPVQVIDQGASLRQVLLDGRQVVEAPAVGRQRLLERSVLEELLPVDLLNPLVLLALLEVGHVGLLGFHGDGVGRARLDGDHVRNPGLFGLPVGVAGAGVDLLVRQDGIAIQLLADLVNELQARELQEANGLLQLRRHHELLTELELLLDLHRRGGRGETGGLAGALKGGSGTRGPDAGRPWGEGYAPRSNTRPLVWHCLSAISVPRFGSSGAWVPGDSVCFCREAAKPPREKRAFVNDSPWRPSPLV